jgi:sugar phosphate isomerase/epimerase
MPFSGFGCSVDEAPQLGEVLATVADAGFTHAEIRPRGWDIWLGGNGSRELARYGSVFERFGNRLRYTLHGPYELNLFDDDVRHRRLLQASVEFAGAIGAGAIVVHPGRMERGVTNAGYSMTELMKREREALLDVVERERSWSGSFALETWYAVEGVAYSYAIWPAQLAGQVEAIAHPRIGACLDIGHLQLAACWFGFDFGEAVRRLSPLAAHIHAHENFGILTPHARVELGQGDMHVPPAWGPLPLDTVFGETSFDRAPVLNVEISATAYRPHLESILAECKRLAACEPTREWRA